MKESIKVLEEAKALQLKKADDYQSPTSPVTQAHYYPRGVSSILDIMNSKVLRLYSVLHKMEQGEPVNYESAEDSAIDLINYASFFVSYYRKKMEGQDTERDIFNR